MGKKKKRGPTPSSRRSSRRFTEVVSLGPTLIPDNDLLAAALSDARSIEESLPGDLRWEKQASEDGLVPQASIAHNGRLASTPQSTPTGCAGAVPAPRAGDSFPSAASNRVGVSDAKHGEEAAGGSLLGWAFYPVRSVIGAVRWAGASVNDVAVAPVMRLAGPWSLAGSLLKVLKAYTPQRARDLARVAGNALINFGGLARTPAGSGLVDSVGRAAVSFSKAVSSPAGRQFAVDYASGFVKLAEALDTPEVKTAIQQGTVVIARGLDLMADRRSKIFLQDTTNAFMRLVELANSNEATVMVAELTANIVHALEMEQMAGTNRQGGLEPSDSGSTDVDMGAIEVGAETPSESSTAACVSAAGTPAAAANVVQDSPRLTAVHSVGALGGDERDAVGDGAFGRDADGQELDPDLRPVPPSRGERVSGDRVEANGLTSRGPPTMTSRNPLGIGSETQAGAAGGAEGESNVAHTRDRDADGGSGGGQRSAIRVISTPITQTDFNNNTRLRITRPRTSRGRPPRDEGCSGGRIHRERSSGAASGGAEESQSAPSSPSGRRDSIHAAVAPATEPSSETGDEARVRRARARSATGLLHGALGADRPSRSVSRDCKGQDGNGGRGVETSRGLEEGAVQRIGEDPHPLAKYTRDGNHFLPRFTGEGFASLLRRPPESLERMLEPPSRAALEHTLRRATGRLQEGTVPAHERSESGGTAHASELAVNQWSLELPADPGVAERGETDDRNGQGGWLHMLFAIAFIAFAIDGLVHRTLGLQWGRDGNERLPDSPSKFPPRYGYAGSDPNGIAESGSRHRFHPFFLPPTCRDPTSGATMAIWASPSGPCLSPGGDVGFVTHDEREGAWGVGRAGAPCARSFRMCSAADTTPGPAQDLGNGSGGGNTGPEHLTATSPRDGGARDSTRAVGGRDEM